MGADVPAGSTPSGPREIILASWGDRFIAWLIDFVIVNVVVWVLIAAVSAPFSPPSLDRGWNGASSAEWIVASLAFFGYWTYFEHRSGQSLGKMVMHLKTTDLAGSAIDIKRAALQSFGKAFVLPIDVIVGWIFTNEKRQRVFERASDTIVIKVKDISAQDVEYRKA